MPLPTAALQLKVKIYNHRQPLMMLLLCMQRQQMKRLPEELWLLIASFLHVMIGLDEYKEHYRHFLVHGNVLGNVLYWDTKLGMFQHVVDSPDVDLNKGTVLTPKRKKMPQLCFAHQPMAEDTDILSFLQRNLKYSEEVTNQERSRGYRRYRYYRECFERGLEKDLEPKRSELEWEKRMLQPYLNDPFSYAPGYGPPKKDKKYDKMVLKIAKLEKEIMHMEQEVKAISESEYC